MTLEMSMSLPYSFVNFFFNHIIFEKSFIKVFEYNLNDKNVCST